MNDALLSIIVPVYNVEKYLERCVESLVSQTYSNCEILLIDDGSTDSSRHMCDEFAIKYKNIRVIHKKNGGQSSARNCGIEEAKGEFIGFVDSDDFIHPQMYEILSGLITESEIDIAACAYEEYYQMESCKFESIAMNEVVHERMSGNEVIEHYWDIGEKCVGIAPWRKLYRKKIFEGLCFKEGIIYEDLYILPDILERSNQIVYTDCPLYYYYQSPGSTIRSPFSKKKLVAIEVWKESIIPMFERHGNKNNLRRAYDTYIDEYRKDMFHVVKMKMKDVQVSKEYKKYYNKLAFRYKLLNNNLGINEKIMYFISLFSMKLCYKYVKVFLKQLGV